MQLEQHGFTVSMFNVRCARPILKFHFLQFALEIIIKPCSLRTLVDIRTSWYFCLFVQCTNVVRDPYWSTIFFSLHYKLLNHDCQEPWLKLEQLATSVSLFNVHIFCATHTKAPFPRLHYKQRTQVLNEPWLELD